MDNIFYKEENTFPIGGWLPIDIPAVMRGVGKKLRDRMYSYVLKLGEPKSKLLIDNQLPSTTLPLSNYLSVFNIFSHDSEDNK